MSVKFVRRSTGDIEMSFDTVEAAAKFYRMVSNGSLSSAPDSTQRRTETRGRKPVNGSVRDVRAQKANSETTAFLAAIDCTPGGLNSKAAGSALKLEDLRGLGGRISKIKRTLHGQGFAPSEVFSMVGYGETRRWKKKKRLGDALVKFRELTIEQNGG